MVIMSEHSLDICENNIEIRMEGPKIQLKTEHEVGKDLCF